jgi:hypothetical protein
MFDLAALILCVAAPLACAVGVVWIVSELENDP